MNTPAHVLINWYALGKTSRGWVFFAIGMGAFIPDLPIFVLFAYAKCVLHLPDTQIWSSYYFQPGWQTAVDLLHSFPVAATGWIVSYWRRWPIAQAFFTSMALHSALDIPVHHDDAHSHFYPLTMYKFESPLSYWDPNHYGHWVSLAECIFSFFAAWQLWKRLPQKGTRSSVLVVSIVYLFNIFFSLYYFSKYIY